MICGNDANETPTGKKTASSKINKIYLFTVILMEMSYNTSAKPIRFHYIFIKMKTIFKPSKLYL